LWQVDCTGQADRDGNKVLLSPLTSSSSSSCASSPAEDAAWIREELHRWIFGNVRAKWESVVRRGEGSRCWQRAVSLFSGYQGYDPRHIIQVEWGGGREERASSLSLVCEHHK
jgi:ribosome-binding ATPase YchF (GTP1/OBG family)